MLCKHIFFVFLTLGNCKLKRQKERLLFKIKGIFYISFERNLLDLRIYLLCFYVKKGDNCIK